MARAWGLAGYDAVNLGENEFNFGPPFLLNALGANGIPAVGADADASALPYLVIDCNGLRIAAVGYRDKKLARPGSNAATPPPAFERTVAAARAAADLVICLAHVPDAAAARAFASSCSEDIDVVVAGHRGDVIPGAEEIDGRRLVYVRPWNRYVGILELEIGREGKVVKCKNTLIPLTRETAEDPAARALVDEYRGALRELVLSKGLLAAPTAVPSAGGAYIGSGKCGSCHEAEASSWRASDHARAYDALVADGRDFDPACVKCHVTGYGFKGGYTNATTTPDLTGVGCEECHGAGADHASAGITLPAVAENTCRRCHQPERNPGFDYQSYLTRVSHK